MQFLVNGLVSGGARSGASRLFQMLQSPLNRSHRRWIRSLLPVLIGVGIIAGSLVVDATVASAAPVLPPGCVVSGAQATCAYSSGTTSFIVPQGIGSALQVTLVGGAGAADSSGMTPGGLGAQLTAALSEASGTTLSVVVGGNASGTNGGANGGGAAGSNGGVTFGTDDYGANGGGGGGASEILQASTPLLVAAGGGGGGGESEITFGSGSNSTYDNAAGPGGNAGMAGAAAPAGTCSNATGGGPGTTTAGGTGGAADCNGSDGTNGANGEALAGGAGGSSQYGASGGGGGGGVFGGGGGGAGLWGFSTGGTSIVYSDPGAGGGGGASLVPTGSTLTTAATGQAPEVIITFTGLAFTSPAPPTGGVNGNYDFQLTTSAQSGVTFSVSAGALPTGLTMSSSGLISGVPSAAGASTFTVAATNDTFTATKQFTVTIEAPMAGVSPTSMAFGDEILTLPSTAQTLTVSATSAAPLAVSTVQLGGADPTDFVVQADNCANTVIQSGGSCTLQVAFAPVAVGARTAVLNIDDDAADSPQTVSLSGTGNQPPVGTINTTPSSGTVGSIVTATSTTPCPGNATTAVLSLSNTSGTDVVTSVVVELTNGGSWVGYLTVPAIAPGSYAVGAQCLAQGKYDVQDYDFVPYTVDAAATATTLSSSANPTQWGEPVSFSASVTTSTGPVPTGSVTFTSGRTVLGTVALTGGSATLSLSSLPVGVDAITATYQPTSGFLSSSASLSQTVDEAATALAAAPASKSAKMFSATLTRSDDGAPIAGQTVLFETASGSTWQQVCSAPTNASGMASCTGTVPVLDQLIDSSYRAVFAGTGSYLGSTGTASY